MFNIIKNKIWRLSCLFISYLLRCFTKIKRNRIICWSYSYTQYSCNPRAITQYLIKEYGDDVEIYWAFKNGVNVNDVDPKIKIVSFCSIKYLYILNTSKVIITNTRINKRMSFFIKRKKQIYIMTWHSSMGIKKVEKDAQTQLDKKYIARAKYDASICDLIISGCKFRTKLYRDSFWYTGEILNCGTPRNDLLFSNEKEGIKSSIYKTYLIPFEKKIVLYAPSFRKDYSLDCYDIDWKIIKHSLKDRFRENYVVLMRLHPNFISGTINVSHFFKKDDDIINVTDYYDIQNLLLVSDILITDYSSSMFDFSLLKKPCFIYAKDLSYYDRGCYFDIENVPFPVATSNYELKKRIEDFEQIKYIEDINNFNNNIIGTYEDGNASKIVSEWILKKTTYD